MSRERIPTSYAALEGEYEIIREIGRGGTALVYLARERATGDEVAIKLIRAKYIEDDEALARFAREARYVAQLDHPNVVPVRAVLDLGASGLAIVMTHVVGRTLTQVIREEHPIHPSRVEQMMRGIANGLGAAHALGIVHRDVKPENVFIDSTGHALLADFGLARSMSAGAETQLTMAGVAIGTPAYMAPEQIDGGQLDGRGDIYSLGLVAWEMLTGKRPWEGESLYAILYHQKYEQLPDVRDIRPDVPDSLADAIAGAIEKDRDARWQTMNDLVAALDGQSSKKRKRKHTPLSNDTMKFARPVLPTPAAPRLPVPPRAQSGDLAAMIASVSEGLEASAAASRAPSRRYVIAGGALVAVVVMALVATKVQGRSNDRSFLRDDVMMPAAAAGDVGNTAARNNSPAKTNGPVDSTLAPTSAPTAAVVSHSDSSTKVAKNAETSSKSAEPVASSKDAPVSVSKPNQTVKAVAPPAIPARNQPSATPQGKPATEPKSAAPEPAPKTVATNIRDSAPASRPAAPPPAVNPRPETAAPATGAPVVTSRANIVAGGMHSCLIATDGRAFCWGGNDHGQLGNGATTRLSTPASIGGDLRFTSVAAGLSHSCAIARGGAAYCWGENDRGQLGDHSNTPHTGPVRVGDNHAFRVIGAGASHSCGIDISGAAWCWGSNSHGQLGDSTTRDSNVPVMTGGGRRFTQLAVGWNFTCGLDSDGHAFCWGDDTAGELGDGANDTDRRIPAPVSGGLSFTSIAAGNAHACGVTVQGDAYCWGRNGGGQLGDGSTSDHNVPGRVKGSARFASITAGGVHTCAVNTEGDAFCWGKNTYGQLGDGGTTDQTTPARVTGAHAFASVRAFGSHTCGATTSGEAFCWGYNLDGQLGDGSRTHRTRPVYIEPPSGG